MPVVDDGVNERTDAGLGEFWNKKLKILYIINKELNHAQINTARENKYITFFFKL